MYLNYAAVDPALTNEKCSFFHFRFDADADMKMQAMSTPSPRTRPSRRSTCSTRTTPSARPVAKAAKAMLPKKRPDIQIVGDDLHPLGKVKDFAPYVAKIKASGAMR
jgi:branched-chain amino acid transport system substrate-binding protein